MGQQILLSEEEKRNIQEMYGLISEQSDCVSISKTDEEKNKSLEDAISRAKSDGYKEVKSFAEYLPVLPGRTAPNDSVFCYFHHSGNIVVHTDYDRKNFLGVVSVNGRPNKTCDLGKAIFTGGIIDKYLCQEIGVDQDKVKYFIKEK